METAARRRSGAAMLRLLVVASVLGACDGESPATGRVAEARPVATTTSAEADTGAATRYITLPPELDRVLRDYERGWRAHDAAALAALFAADGFVMAEGRLPVRGRAAITRAYTGEGGPLVLRALAASASDTLGWIVGTYARADSEPDAGKFVLALRRSPNARWEIAADIDNGIRR